jgi:hypothetical protein
MPEPPTLDYAAPRANSRVSFWRPIWIAAVMVAAASSLWTLWVVVAFLNDWL